MTPFLCCCNSSTGRGRHQLIYLLLLFLSGLVLFDKGRELSNFRPRHVQCLLVLRIFIILQKNCYWGNATNHSKLQRKKIYTRSIGKQNVSYWVNLTKDISLQQWDINEADKQANKLFKIFILFAAPFWVILHFLIVKALVESFIIVSYDLSLFFTTYHF